MHCASCNLPTLSHLLQMFVIAFLTNKLRECKWNEKSNGQSTTELGLKQVFTLKLNLST